MDKVLEEVSDLDQREKWNKKHMERLKTLDQPLPNERLKNLTYRVPKEYRLDLGELLREFGDWKVLYYEENEGEGRMTIFCQKQSDY